MTSDAGRAAIALLARYLTPADVDPPRAPVLIFGGATLSPAEAALGLHRAGRAQVLVARASAGTFSDASARLPEALRYREYLLAHGVPAGDLVVETTCTHTMAECLGFFEVASRGGRRVARDVVILCARPLHQRRALATFRRAHPGVRAYSAPGAEPLDPDAALPRIVEELVRLDVYADRGFLDPGAPGADVVAARRELSGILADEFAACRARVLAALGER